MSEQTICRRCSSPVDEARVFCPECGAVWDRAKLESAGDRIVGGFGPKWHGDELRLSLAKQCNLL
jgi:hypothetical protein